MVTMRRIVRPIALTIVAPAAGFLLIFLLEVFLKTEVSKLTGSLINLVLVSFIAFVIFPRWLGIPYGKIELREFLRRTGLYWPENGWKHLLLGLILGGCTLSGMLLASILTGRYKFDASTINLSQLVFSLNPALWEELFYRGVLMALLLKFTGSLRKAILIQVLLFGLMHIKGGDFWAMVDVFSVMILALGFTYTAYKTGTLVASILFHYVHDAFLFAVLLPGDGYTGAAENLMFYGLLWLMVGVGCVITWLASRRFGVSAPAPLYPIESDPSVTETHPVVQQIVR